MGTPDNMPEAVRVGSAPFLILVLLTQLSIIIMMVWRVAPPSQL